MMDKTLRPAPFLDHYLLFLLARASAVASGQFHASLAERGIPVLTWRVVAVLSDGPTTVGALARAVMEKQATLSKALDRLEADGLIMRKRDAQDRRKVTVHLRQDGRAMAETLIPAAQRHQETLLASYDQRERDALMTILRDFLEIAERDTPSSH